MKTLIRAPGSRAVGALAALILACGASAGAARADAPSVGNLRIKDQGAFFVGGKYNDPTNPTFMSGHMYVRYQVPADSLRAKDGNLKRYPIVMIHGGGQQSTTFTGTPDGRPGWADYFLSKGWTVYVVDQPGRGRAAYINSVYGPRGTPNLATLQDQFTATERAKLWPQAVLHTQWPGTGVHGDATFDQFFASQFTGMDALSQEIQTTNALVALLDQIGPAILVTHSQSGPHGWTTADARPKLVKAMLVVEPNGPPFYNDANTNIDRPWGIARLPLTFSPPASSPSDLNPVQEAAPQAPDLYRCWNQGNPARKLTNLAGIPILLVTSEASFRAQYDHCTSQFLSKAGVKNDHVNLGEVGIHGNGHMMMLEKNNLEIAALMETWLRKKLTGGKPPEDTRGHDCGPHHDEICY